MDDARESLITDSSNASIPDNVEDKPFHDASINCRCGCVPNIMSLFQMAELRAKRRKEAKASDANNLEVGQQKKPDKNDKV